MKKSTYLIPIAVALLLGIFWSADSRSQSGPIKGTGEEIVMIRCSPLAFTVAAYKGSPAAPARKSTSCPEQVSILVKQGYAILDVGYLDARDQQNIVYTLSK